MVRLRAFLLLRGVKRLDNKVAVPGLLGRDDDGCGCAKAGESPFAL